MTTATEIQENLHTLALKAAAAQAGYVHLMRMDWDDILPEWLGQREDIYTHISVSAYGYVDDWRAPLKVHPHLGICIYCLATDENGFSRETPETHELLRRLAEKLDMEFEKTGLSGTTVTWCGTKRTSEYIMKVHVYTGVPAECKVTEVEEITTRLVVECA